MNEFFFSAVVLCTVCVLLECLLPKNHGELGSLCALFAVVCILGIFTLSDGISLPSSSPVDYPDMASYAFCEACEREISEICKEYGVSDACVTVTSSDGQSVWQITVRTEKNELLAARLREIFGCEVIFG